MHPQATASFCVAISVTITVLIVATSLYAPKVLEFERPKRPDGEAAASPSEGFTMNDQRTLPDEATDVTACSKKLDYGLYMDKQECDAFPAGERAACIARAKRDAANKAAFSFNDCMCTRKHGRTLEDVAACYQSAWDPDELDGCMRTFDDQATYLTEMCVDYDGKYEDAPKRQYSLMK